MNENGATSHASDDSGSVILVTGANAGLIGFTRNLARAR
jgi:hypothetical protein